MALKIRKVIGRDGIKRFKALEGVYHYMGETHSGGDTMRLVIEEDGEWLALMVWGSACYHLKARDGYVGWPASLRVERRKLVVANRRFTILKKPGERRNLASQCLGLATRELPVLWFREFGYRPLLAETFCDIERATGTCYKAANWTPLGMTKGFTRVNRQECDFHVPNDRPKTLWVMPLAKDALKTLIARELPDECLRGAMGNASGVMPLGVGARESLFEALRHVKAVETARHPVAPKKTGTRPRATRGQANQHIQTGRPSPTRAVRRSYPHLHETADTGAFGAPKGEKSAVETVYHASSVRIDEAHGVEYFADAVRNQWSIEAKYHARRDGTFCEDIRTRRCNANVVGAMLLARSAAFVFFARSGTTNCQEFKERLQANPTKTFRLVTCNNT